MWSGHGVRARPSIYCGHQFTFFFTTPPPSLFWFCVTQKAGQRPLEEKKKSSLLLSLSHGSNTITMGLPGPQGTVQYTVRAPNESTLHTMIMERALALFFYCYQSVMHLQSSILLTLLTLLPLSSLPPSLSFPPFFLSLSTPLPLSVALSLNSWISAFAVSLIYWGMGVGGSRYDPALLASILAAIVNEMYWSIGGERHAIERVLDCIILLERWDPINHHCEQ